MTNSTVNSDGNKKIFEISGGSIIEIDVVLDLCIELNYSKKENIQLLV